MFRFPLIGVALVSVLWGAAARADLSNEGIVDDDIMSLIYDPGTGGLALDAADERWSSLEIRSASSILRPWNLIDDGSKGPFDVQTPSKLFRLRTDGAGDTQFGPVLPPRLNRDMLVTELSVEGSLLPSGKIREVDLIIVPEPASLGLLVLGVLSLALVFRRI